MKLYIPEIGDVIRLTQDWTFDLYNEYRNSTMMERIGDTRDTACSWENNFNSIPVTVPAGSELKVDRIYIRKGKEDCSSITFLWMGEKTNPKMVKKFAVAFGVGAPVRTDYEIKRPARTVRFWAKLTDVNNLEFDWV